jgi:thioredoxin 1
MQEISNVDNLEGVYVLDFWAPWCGPCKTVVPALEEASRVLPDINFYKINVDENKDLNSKFGILSIPTIIIMQDDTEVKRFIGNTSADNIISNIISVI